MEFLELCYSDARKSLVQELEKSYEAARRELNEIKKRVEAAATEEALLRAVVDAENAISREHTTWVVRRADWPEGGR